MSLAVNEGWQRLRTHAPWVGTAVVAALVLFQFLDARATVGRRVGMTVEPRDEGLVVSEIDVKGPAAEAGLVPGDLLVEVAGVPVPTTGAYDVVASRFARGEPVTFDVRRDGALVTLKVLPGYPFDWLSFLFPVVNVVLLLGIGWAALRKSPGYLNGYLLFLFCLAVAVELALPQATIGAPVLAKVMQLTLYLVSALQMGLEIHLVSLIPERPMLLRQRRWIVPAVYAASMAIGVVASIAYLVAEVGWISLPSMAAFNQGLLNVELTVWALSVAGILAYRAVTYQDVEGRVQAGIVLLGVLPWVVYILSDIVRTLTGMPLPAWMDTRELLNVVVAFHPVAILAILLRSAVIRDRTLLDLADEIQERSSSEDMAALVARSLETALHPRWVQVFLLARKEEELLLGHSSGAVRRPSPRPPLVHFLEIAKRRARPFAPTPDVLAELPEEEVQWLEDAGPRLVVPLVGTADHLVGFILLGRKKSEDPYSPHDYKLLRSVAGQVAVALENLRLQEDVSRGQRVEREVLSQLRDQAFEVVKECPRCGRCYDGTADVCEDDGRRLELSLPVERVIEGRYRLDLLLGTGGMGAVYEALDLRLDRKVAVKVLQGRQFGDPTALRRFEREARVCARLNHPNLVAVYDYGATRRGGAFLVMERLEGLTLRDELDRRGRLDVASAAEWFDQLLVGLAHAHSERVVHRDLKPSNVWLSPREGEAKGPAAMQVKLLDFGLAKVVGQASAMHSLTAPGAFMGTLSYMAPEQVTHGEVDERADLFAVGVMLVESLTGDRPFQGDSTLSLTNAILRDEVHLPTPTAEWRELDAALQRVVAKRPRDRVATAAETRELLIPLLRRCADLAGVAAPRHEKAPATQPLAD